MGEGIAPHDCLVVLDRVAGEAGDEPRGFNDLGCVRTDLNSELILSSLDRHDDLFGRGVAGPFADAVDRTFDLAGAGRDGRERIGDGQTEIVVAVDRDDHVVVPPLTSLEHLRQEVDVVGRGGVTDRVGMLRVVAPASTAALQMAIRKSGSVRVASCGENSTSSVYCRALVTPSFTDCNTSSGVIRSIFSIWIGEVDMNTWMRNCSPPRTASAASVDVVRCALASCDDRALHFLAMWATASKSPWRRRRSRLR